MVRAFCFSLLLGCMLFFAGAAHAGGSGYYIIQPATSPNTAGYAMPTTKPTYAWGFFGARAQPQGYWQHGYYNNYRQLEVIEPFRK